MSLGSLRKLENLGKRCVNRVNRVDRVNRVNRDDWDDKDLKTLGPLRWLRTNFLMVLSVLIVPIISRIPPQLARNICCQKGCRCGLDMKKPRMGHTKRISHSGL